MAGESPKAPMPALEMPDFENLPRLPGTSMGCTWGMWDGQNRDEFGALNLLTPDVVKDAASEIQEGISVSLNWSLAKPVRPVFGRQGLRHSITDNSTFSSSMSFDDTVTFNTQSGSQWDGLRHCIHHETGKLYNGIGKEEIIGPQATTVLEWHDRGVVAGRGVLIDYVAYAERHNIEYSPVKYFEISHHDLHLAAKEQGVLLKQGDVLLVRSGLVKWYEECTSEVERDAYFTNPSKEGVGVAPTPDTVAWIWNHHFSAVAGDALAWEPVPYPSDKPAFHQHLLALWGMPIGELWDLERLAETCAQLRRYSFFITSCPLNVPGGVASPPNAVAVF